VTVPVSVARPHHAPRPFLKWAGGKRQLLPVLRRFYPSLFGTYHEPFLGSGAVFFDLEAQGRLGRRRVVLADTNLDVVGCYRAIAHDVEAVIEHLGQLAREHARGGSSFYYEVRDHRFNPMREALQQERAGDAHEGASYPAELAAMLIYLNRTGFNGLFRLNARGLFNVPAGRYRQPRICDPDNLRACAATLSRREVELRCQSFEAVLDQAAAGDFIYFDPPYVPLGKSASFTAYTAAGFPGQAHRQLQQIAVTLASRGCHVLLSNSSAPLVRDLYERSPEAARAGLRIYHAPARRAINARASARGPITELIVANTPRTP
jgi:DNA adenine methylase